MCHFLSFALIAAVKIYSKEVQCQFCDLKGVNTHAFVAGLIYRGFSSLFLLLWEKNCYINKTRDLLGIVAQQFQIVLRLSH